MIISNIFPPHVRGGYELGILDVARGFVAAGHEVEIVTSMAVGMLRKRSPVTDLIVRDVLAPVIAYEPDLAERLANSPVWTQQRTDALGGVHAANIVALQTEIARFKPDRIWIGNPLGVGPVSILETALSAGVPVIVHLMDDIDRYFVEYRRPLHWLSRIRRLKQSLTAISCSTHVRDVNSEVGSYGEHFVVLNGFDFSSIAAHAQPGRHDGPLRFVYAGQVEPMKGIPQLIEGVTQLCASADAPSFTLDLIGPSSNSYAESLALEIRTRGLADRVRLIGRLEKSELLRRLAEYDAAALLLKQDEPFGYAWLEAAAVGLPVVVTRGFAVGEAFPDTYPLFVHDRNDAAEVASALRWCTTHRGSLAAVGQALGHHLAGVCDTFAVIRPRYEAILESAAPPKRKTDCESLMASVLTCDAFGMMHSEWSPR
jgi:glycosyltransferase involved in cell wall biosynthesis